MATLERGIVTPEAVVLEFDTAGIASRALARTIDALIQAGLLLALILVAVAGIGGEGWAALVLVIVGVALIVIGYPFLTEVVTGGRSPGKAALGLRVVTVEGAPVAARHAFIRSAIGLVDFVLVPGGMVAVLTALFSSRSQRLGDVFAGTMVLRERTATRPPLAVWFNPPPGLEDYAASLDVSALTDAQFGVVRAYLLRLADLSPEARASLSVRLSTPIVAAMRHQTPPGVHADHFLQCVAASYQRRHADAPVAPAWGAPPLPRHRPRHPGRRRRYRLPLPPRRPRTVATASWCPSDGHHRPPGLRLALPRPRREHPDAP